MRTKRDNSRCSDVEHCQLSKYILNTIRSYNELKHGYYRGKGFSCLSPLSAILQLYRDYLILWGGESEIKHPG
jgi:hypothetical protein